MLLPPDVLERVASTVEELADTPEVESFLLSRSSAPAQESKGLGADAVVDVFRSEDIAEVEEVHAFLSERFAGHEKARELTVDSRQGATHVYVALWAVPDISDPNA